MSDPFWIKNAKLETGICREDSERVTTETELYDLFIENGKLSNMVPSSGHVTPEDVPVIDSKNLLILPAFKDMHFHLDKTYYGSSWQACIPFKNIFTRIEEEQELLPRLLPTVQERAEKILQLLLQNGVTEVRTHCNIDQVVGLKNLEATLKAVESFSDRLICKIVAFPQHGLLRSESVSLVREALRNGADLVGGLDPGNVDLDIEKSLQTMMELAVESDSDIDIHLHDPGHLGLFTMKRLADLTEKSGWQNRVTISHAIGLSDICKDALQDIASTFQHLGINVASVVSSRKNSHLIPIPTLKEMGVDTLLGTDTVMDHWSPFGQGDVLGKLTSMAEYFRLLDEQSLAQSLGYITGGKTPLDENGKQVWPKVGDTADFIFVQATCSAEVVARKVTNTAVMHRGKIVAGTL